MSVEAAYADICEACEREVMSQPDSLRMMVAGRSMERVEGAYEMAQALGVTVAPTPLDWYARVIARLGRAA